MAFEWITLAVCVFALLAGSSQARDQASTSPPALALTSLPHYPDSSAPPHRTEAPWGDASQQTHTPAASASHITTIAWTDGTVHSGTTQLLTSSALAVASSQHAGAPTTTTVLPGHPSPSGDSLSSTPTNSGRSTPPQHPPTGSGAPLTKDPPSTVSSRPAHTAYETRSPAHTSTFQPRSESLTTVTAAQPATTGHHVTPTTGRGPAGSTHQEAPSELNVGDEDPKGHRLHPSSPLDPLMAGLLSVFIVTTAIVFIVLFLKFRQRTNHPEFHRLQDLPMDDLMEDTPLSRYTY